MNVFQIKPTDRRIYGPFLILDNATALADWKEAGPRNCSFHYPAFSNGYKSASRFWPRSLFEINTPFGTTHERTPHYTPDRQIPFPLVHPLAIADRLLTQWLLARIALVGRIYSHYPNTTLGIDKQLPFASITHLCGSKLRSCRIIGWRLTDC